MSYYLFDRLQRQVPYSAIVQPDGNQYIARIPEMGIEFSGTNAASVINNALSAINYSGKLVLVGNNLIINQTINIPSANGLVIEGINYGNPVTLKLGNGVNAPMFKIMGQGAMLKNLRLDGNKANNPTGGIGVEFYGISTTATSNACVVKDCIIENFKQYGVYIHDYVYFSGIRNCVIGYNGVNAHFENLPDRCFYRGNVSQNADTNELEINLVSYMRIVDSMLHGSQKSAVVITNSNHCKVDDNIIVNVSLAGNGQGFGIYAFRTVNCRFCENIFVNEAGNPTPQDWINIDQPAVAPFADGNLIAGNRFASPTIGPPVIAGTPQGNNIAINNFGYNPQGFSIATPAMPASGTAQTNTFPFPVIVYLYGGTVTQITINGQVVFSSGTGISLTGQSFTLNPGDTIAITYTAAPTWKWYGL